MKQLSVLALFLCFVFPLFSQGELSDSNKAKALRKAKAEAKMFVKKGMSNVSESVGTEAVLIDFYEKVFMENSPNSRTFVWGMGNGKSSSSEEAYRDALEDAKDHIPGVLSLYFNTWIMVADLSEKDKTSVQSAISDAGPAYTAEILSKEPVMIVYLMGESKGKFRTQVRVLYNQEEVRSLCREEIKKYLKEETGWSEEKMTKVLTFEH